MYPPQTPDHRTNRDPPTFGTTLLFAAVPLAVVFAAAFPATAAGVFAGLIAGTALQR